MIPLIALEVKPLGLVAHRPAQTPRVGTTFALSPLSSSGHVVAPVARARFYLATPIPEVGPCFGESNLE
jgi:hypothetical protein